MSLRLVEVRSQTDFGSLIALFIILARFLLHYGQNVHAEELLRN